MSGPQSRRGCPEGMGSRRQGWPRSPDHSPQITAPRSQSSSHSYRPLGPDLCPVPATPSAGVSRGLGHPSGPGKDGVKTCSPAPAPPTLARPPGGVQSRTVWPPEGGKAQWLRASAVSTFLLLGLDSPGQAVRLGKAGRAVLPEAWEAVAGGGLTARLWGRSRLWEDLQALVPR